MQGQATATWKGSWSAEESLVSLTSSLMTTRLHGISSDLTADSSRDPEQLSPLPPVRPTVTPVTTPAGERQRGSLLGPPSGDG